MLRRFYTKNKVSILDKEQGFKGFNNFLSTYYTNNSYLRTS